MAGVVKLFAVGAVGVILMSGSAVVSAQQYTYDSVGRMVRVVYSNGATVTYSYDKAGNRSVETTVVGVGPAPTSVGVMGTANRLSAPSTAAPAQAARSALPERNRAGVSAPPSDSAARVVRTQ